MPLLRSKRWMMVAAIGQGVMFSLALRGAVSFASVLLDRPLSERAGNFLFLISSLLTGAVCALAYARYARQAEQYAATMPRSEPE